MKSVVFLIVTAASLLLGQTPCGVEGRFTGTWDGKVSREGLKKGKGNYWSLACNVDTTNWFQLVEWNPKGKKQPKVMLTFRTKDFGCYESDSYVLCDIVTDIEVIPGRQNLTFTWYGGEYECKSGEHEDPDGICYNTAKVMVPDSSFKQAAKACLKRGPDMCKGHNAN